MALWRLLNDGAIVFTTLQSIITYSPSDSKIAVHFSILTMISLSFVKPMLYLQHYRLPD